MSCTVPIETKYPHSLGPHEHYEEMNIIKGHYDIMLSKAPRIPRLHQLMDSLPALHDPAMLLRVAHPCWCPGKLQPKPQVEIQHSRELK